MTQNKLDYSTEMIFSSLLYNYSHKEYRLLRDGKNIILPRKLTLSTYMNPLIEQYDNNFLVRQDTTVSLLVDESHIKCYFDYKVGNIVGLSDNSNEAATSAFAFMLRSVFSQYKDIEHVMPTKFLKAENLFDIVKRIIIGLEEIGFQVLSIITDNTWKPISPQPIIICIFLFQSPKAFHCISTPNYEVSTSFFPIRLSPYIEMH